MKIVQINTVDYGSTGRIMLQIAQHAREHGHDVRTFSVAPRRRTAPPKGHTYYCSFGEYAIHYVLGRFTGGNGRFGVLATARLIRELRAFAPDVVHLHNLHGFCVNLPMLFDYLKKSGVRVVWTLHDCWSFTGHCPHFLITGCDKWKTGCHRCPSFRDYPQSCVDHSRSMWKNKKKWFGNLPSAVMATPSQWLADLVKQSFLGEYPVRVINNGIDLSVFRPTPGDFRHRYGIKEDEFVLLGVAFDWGYRKGLDVFVKLAQSLDKRFRIVLVGTDETIDAQLPENIISIHRTADTKELAEIYSAADVFVNPTREDNFPTVNIEALACGTPVVTFATGGCTEIVDETCGLCVLCGDVEALQKAVCTVCENKLFSAESCVKRAYEYDAQSKFGEYTALYKGLFENQKGV